MWGGDPCGRPGGDVRACPSRRKVPFPKSLYLKASSKPTLIPPGNELLLCSQRCGISTGWMKGKDTTQSCAGCIVAAHSMYTATWWG